MKLAILILPLFFLSCGQSYNSHTNDDNFGDLITCTDTSNTRLCQANEIIYQKCANCHDRQYHSDWFNYKTDQAWVESGDIIPGDAANSQLILKLKNEGGNMPPEGPPLPQEEYDTLTEWINNI